MSHRNASFHISMRHDTYERVMSQKNNSLRIWHAIFERVTLHINESCDLWMNHVMYEWVTSHMNESCHTQEVHMIMGRVHRGGSVKSRKWVTWHINESCHIWMSHDMSHMNESCHIWMSHVKYEGVTSHMNESCHTQEVQMIMAGVHGWGSATSKMDESRHIWLGHVTYGWVMSRMNVSCYIYMSHVAGVANPGLITCKTVYYIIYGYRTVYYITHEYAWRTVYYITYGYRTVYCVTYENTWRTVHFNTYGYRIVYFITYLHMDTGLCITSHIYTEHCVSHHIWISLSHKVESRHIWMSHVPYIWYVAGVTDPGGGARRSVYHPAKRIGSHRAFSKRLQVLTKCASNIYVHTCIQMYIHMYIYKNI